MKNIGMQVMGWVVLAAMVFISAAEASASGRLIIFGLDETGSYSLRAKAVAIARGVINEMSPGDVFYARRITHESYMDNCSVMRMALPRVGAKPDNQFDRKALLAWQRQQRKVATLKVQAGAVLARLQQVGAPKTDIWGFLAAAADRIAAEKHGRAGVVILIASDMQDNVRRRVGLDLKGAQVVIAGFETGADPRKARRIKQSWQKALGRARAGEVVFLPPDVTFSLSGLAQAVR